MDDRIYPWLVQRDTVRNGIAKSKSADGRLTSAIRAHDLALEALVEGQEHIPKRLKSIEKLSEQQHNWLSTFALIFQSIDVARSLILRAVYAPSCAVLKQEWDGISVLVSIYDGKKSFGKSPNIQNKLGKTPNQEHRLLQPIAHLTGEGLGRAWAVDAIEDTEKFRPTPKFMPDVTIKLLNARSYLIGHLFLQLQAFLDPIKALDSEEKLREVMTHLKSQEN